jgi:hypothetical protein
MLQGVLQKYESVIDGHLDNAKASLDATGKATTTQVAGETVCTWSVPPLASVFCHSLWRLGDVTEPISFMARPTPTGEEQVGARRGSIGLMAVSHRALVCSMCPRLLIADVIFFSSSCRYMDSRGQTT